MTVASRVEGQGSRAGEEAWLSVRMLRLSNLTWLGPAALLVVTAGVTLFFDLGGYRTLTEHEAYAAVPAREMLQSGDWIVPRFGGVPRLRKPPLNYWVLAGTGWLLGEFSEWTVRLPSAVASVLLALLVGHWARRWYGDAAGVAAVLVQLTSVWVVTYGRKAEVDILLCLLTTGAMWLVAGWDVGESKRRRFWRICGVWALLSVAWLAKFHYGPAVVLAACGAFLCVQRLTTWRDTACRDRATRRVAPLLWAFFLSPGVLLFAGAVLVWPMLLLREIPEAWQVWRTETVGRAVGELQPRAVWFYVPHLLSLALPWTPFAIAAAPQSWRRAWREGDARERFLWIWLIAQFVLLTLSVNKHRHYLFATMPVLSLLAAQRLAELRERVARGEILLSERAAKAIAAVIFLGGIAAAALAWLRWPQLAGPVSAAGAIGLVGGTISVLLVSRRSHRGGLAAGGIAAGAICVIVFGWIVPEYDHRANVVQFAAAVRKELPSERLYVYGMGEHPIVFYAGGPVVRVESARELREVADARGDLWAIAVRRDIEELERVARVRVAMECEVARDDAREGASVLVHLATAIDGEASPRRH